MQGLNDKTQTINPKKQIMKFNKLGVTSELTISSVARYNSH